MEADAPIDIGRLSRPEADAFRYIAKALGAQFAGDLPDDLDPDPLSRFAGEVFTTRWDKPKGSMHDVAPVDEKACALLERLPIACVVIVNDDIAFINRAAVMLFGYSSANILEAAGGTGALFASGRREQPGIMTMRTAEGQTFGARVTMATIEWGGEKAMLLTALPSEAPSGDAREGKAEEPSIDPLLAVMDANPDPIAIVSRGGHVELYNRAFEALRPGRKPVRLEELLDAGDLRHVFDVMNLSFLLAEGPARSPKPVTAGQDQYALSVGALREQQLACLVFHKVPPAQAAADEADAPEPEPETLAIEPPAAVEARVVALDQTGARSDDVEVVEVPRVIEAEPVIEAVAVETPVGETAEDEEAAALPGTPLMRAVRDVRRLVHDAAVLLVSDRDELAEEPASRAGDEEVDLLRLVLLTIATRGEPRAVLTVRRDGASIVVDVPGAPERALERVSGSDRIATLAGVAHRTVTVDLAGSVTIAPAEDVADTDVEEN
ncbi:hypothetical protein DLJ53_30390 [Acuticoccus sediminis]|uniref:PAS domain-containing protein n=1 Tax=Acuticoccus sediminis TaxID=2184697 RepID=A0A8B2NKZ0_9HYPH|nr:PAS domain-containing protein [Acuticoccus sediminis]RAH96987.1 hypothetical protein DLJ53_30390 [Acuticoccus sediminis]